MFTPEMKQIISQKVQEILKNTWDDELPFPEEISFILHVDGKESWSWANIRNESEKSLGVPNILIGNLTIKE